MDRLEIRLIQDATRMLKPLVEDQEIEGIVNKMIKYLS